MPDLDVSDAFDPSFWDTLTVDRRTETEDNHGRTVETTVNYPFDAVVTATSPDDLQRVPEDEYMNKTITVYTQFRLRGPGPGISPDIVHWHGTSFIVRAIDDFTGYGEGFLAAVCVAIETNQPTVSDTDPGSQPVI